MLPPSGSSTASSDEMRLLPARTATALSRAALVAGAVAVVPPPVVAQKGASPAPSVTPGFAAGEWLDSDAQIELAVSPPLLPERGHLAVFIRETDVTSLFIATPQKLTYRPRSIRLPAGDSEIVVHFVGRDHRWQEIGRFPIRVRTRAGFEQSSFDPKLDVGTEGQVAEGHVLDASAPPRGTYQDFTTNTGFTTVHVRSGWTVQSQLNVVGVSHREKALRFEQDSVDAPRVDLSDYRVEVEKGIARASLGHVTWGANRHLVNQFQSRGATLSLRLGPRADLTTAWLHGSTIVGWNHFLGVDRREHRFGAATLGLEGFPSRPGLLRLEATALTGSLLPLSGFNQGVVNDAEKSRAWGMRLLAATPGQRVRFEAGYSRSRFDNPEDPLLEQGAALVEVRETTRSARYLEASYDVVQAWAITPSIQGRLTAAYRHERADPLYRTIAAVVQADRSSHGFELQGAVGEVSVQLLHTRYRDNLDDVPSILVTRGRDYELTASAPLGFIFGAAKRPAWLPSLSYHYQRIHQKGDGVPDNSGARPTFVPDQVSAVHGLGLDWQGGQWRASYKIDHSTQDNRQPEREQADNANLVHGATLGYTPVPAVTVGLELELERAENQEIARTDRTLRAGLSVDWQVTSATALGVRWSQTDAEDDAHLRETGSSDLSLQVTQRLDVLTLGGWALPGQAYLRFGRQTLRSLDREFQVGDARRNWTINTGLSLNLFSGRQEDDHVSTGE
jgi:hypothetical protein